LFLITAAGPAAANKRFLLPGELHRMERREFIKKLCLRAGIGSVPASWLQGRPGFLDTISPGKNFTAGILTTKKVLKNWRSPEVPRLSEAALPV
jgi:hypothetical protein